MGSTSSPSTAPPTGVAPQSGWRGRGEAIKIIDEPIPTLTDEEIRRELAPPTRRPPITFEQVVNAVAREYGVTIAELFQSQGRHRRIVDARNAVVYLARKLTTLSFWEITRRAGVSHSTNRDRYAIAQHEVINQSAKGLEIEALGRRLEKA